MELVKRVVEHKDERVIIELTCLSRDDARELFQALLEKMERGETLIIRAAPPRESK